MPRPAAPAATRGARGLDLHSFGHLTQNRRESLGDFYNEIVGPFWPPERELWRADIAACHFLSWRSRRRRFKSKSGGTLEHLLGYLRTWSATQRFIAERRQDPVDKLSPIWRRLGVSRGRAAGGLATNRTDRPRLTSRILNRARARNRSSGQATSDQVRARVRLRAGARVGEQRGRPLRAALRFHRASFSLAFALRNYFVQLEDRQEHRDHDAAHDHSKEHDQKWLDQRGHRVEHASTSSSQKSAIFSSMVSIRPVDSPAATIRRSIGGKIFFFDIATERLSPFSTSALAPLNFLRPRNCRPSRRRCRALQESARHCG